MIIYDDDGIGYDVIPRKTVKDIRAEIIEEIESYRIADWESNNLLADGLQMALNIIDKNIGEGSKENENT